MTRKRDRASSTPVAEAQVEIGPGLVLGFLGLVVLAAGLTWWWIGRGPAAAPQALAPTPAAGAGASTAPAIDPVQSGGRTPEGDPFLGAPDAPVTIVEFSDFQCPNCRQFATEVLPWMRQTWLAEGFVRVVYRDFAIRGEPSYLAAHAAHCAGDQGRYWEYHDLVFQMAGGTRARAIDEQSLSDLAGGLGLDMTAFQACNSAGRHRQRIEGSADYARSQGFEGTPTYLINGRRTQGAIEIADWDELFRLFQQELGAPARGS